MRIQVEDGTTNSNIDLCTSCIFMFRIRTENNLTYTRCNKISVRVHNKIAECNSYSPIKQPDGMFYKLAWGDNLDINTGVSGFYHPQDMSWAKKLPPAPTPIIITPPPRRSWRQKLRSKLHSLLDIILRPITKVKR